MTWLGCWKINWRFFLQMSTRLNVRWESVLCSFKWWEEDNKKEHGSRWKNRSPTSWRAVLHLVTLLVISTFCMTLLYVYISSPLQKMLTSKLLYEVQKESEVLKYNINRKHVSTNIRINKLGLQYCSEWKLYYKNKWSLEKMEEAQGTDVFGFLFLWGEIVVIERKNYRFLVTSLLLICMFFCVSPVASQLMLWFCGVPDMSWRLLLIIYNPARLANFFLHLL